MRVCLFVDGIPLFDGTRKIPSNHFRRVRSKLGVANLHVQPALAMSMLRLEAVVFHSEAEARNCSACSNPEDGLIVPGRRSEATRASGSNPHDTHPVCPLSCRAAV